MKGTARVLPRGAGEVTPKAAEGAREMPPLEMCAENKDVRDAPLRHAPSTMLRMVPLPHMWGRIRGVGTATAGDQDKERRHQLTAIR